MIKHDAAGHRFTTRTSDGTAYLSYEPAAERTLDFQHTIVPEAAQGRGVGESLVRHALDYAREGGYQVIPSCPFVAAYVEKHTEVQDLVRGDG